MEKITLSQYVAELGQCNVAEKLGVTQAAIRKALLKKRKIFIFLENGQFVHAMEERTFPSSKANQKGCKHE